jgi:hypothetical protein
MVLYMLLLVAKICKGGEHACDPLYVSVIIGISIYRRERGENGEHARILFPTISVHVASPAYVFRD